MNTFSSEVVTTLETGRWRILALLALAELLGMSLWFSASAVVPALRVEWSLTDSEVSWLTIAVQLGFVFGTLASALLNLADVISTRHLVVVSAFLGASANASFAYFAHDTSLGIPLRFLTGMFLAGVYPPGMKIMATWFRRSRGMALGVLVGALTLGKAAPYLINAIVSSDWRHNVMTVSILAAIGGLIVLLFVSDGPYGLPRAQFDWKQGIKIFNNRPGQLANLGFFWDLWGLYAMWTWMPVMLRASMALSKKGTAWAEVGSFAMIGSGAIGCVSAGLIADRVGRTLVTSWAMAISGTCCLVIGILYGGNPGLLLLVAAIWGASVVGDSAQFSSCVTQLGDPQYIGTALTIQMCIGFLLTTISIELVPKIDNWRYAFMILAPGPLFGVISMLRLRQLPEALKIAHGKR